MVRRCVRVLGFFLYGVVGPMCYGALRTVAYVEHGFKDSAVYEHAHGRTLAPFFVGSCFCVIFCAMNGAKGLCPKAPKAGLGSHALRRRIRVWHARGRDGACVGATPGFALATVVWCGRSNTVVLCVLCGDLRM